ncbi:hypothetical protein L596_018358 [Steinernema carpocapsae]|uniref:BHLH domain-containing protein n=1 Tax=Steinernema carpocapsae TaxID=34508 RepID=A0A4U5N4P4_STECR|nr:hypothetical protein L596_018358 [Steinernema carpocapsae]
MVLSESLDDEMQQFSGKTSCNEDEDEEFGAERLSPWSNENESSSSRKVSSTCRPGQSSPVGVGGGTNVPISAEDRRLRRQIANCNERRRMQSINAGFQALRSLLPKKDGEKMSKAAILQHTADLIHQLMSSQRSVDMLMAATESSKKRKLDFGDVDGDHQVSDYVKTIDELKDALDREHTIRVACQRELLELKAQLNIVTSSAVSPVANDLLLGQQRLDLSPASAQPTPNPLLGSIALLNSPLAPLLEHHQTPSVSPPLMHHPLPQRPSPCSSTALGSNGSANGFPATSSALQQQLQMLQNSSAELGDPQSSPTSSQAVASHRNLQAIIEAIRHLEGQQAANVAASSPAATHGGNVLVR